MKHLWILSSIAVLLHLSASPSAGWGAPVTRPLSAPLGPVCPAYVSLLDPASPGPCNANCTGFSLVNVVLSTVDDCEGCAAAGTLSYECDGVPKTFPFDETQHCRGEKRQPVPCPDQGSSSKIKIVVTGCTACPQ